VLNSVTVFEYLRKAPYIDLTPSLTFDVRRGSNSCHDIYCIVLFFVDILLCKFVKMFL
jgi:hypothetical protein